MPPLTALKKFFTKKNPPLHLEINPSEPTPLQESVLLKWVADNPNLLVSKKLDSQSYSYKVNYQNKEYTFEFNTSDENKAPLSLLQNAKSWYVCPESKFNDRGVASLYAPLNAIRFKDRIQSVKPKQPILLKLDTINLWIGRTEDTLKEEAQFTSEVYHFVDKYVSVISTKHPHYITGEPTESHQAFFIQPQLAPSRCSLEDFFKTPAFKSMSFDELLVDLILPLVDQVCALPFFHNDLCDLNVVFDPKTKKLYLCDFGAASQFGKSNRLVRPDTYPYLDCVEKDVIQQAEKSADFYALGVLITEILGNENMKIRTKHYDNLQNRNNYVGVRYPELNIDLSRFNLPPEKEAAIKTFITRMTNPIKDWRPTAEYIRTSWHGLCTPDMAAKYRAQRKTMLPLFRSKHQKRLLALDAINAPANKDAPYPKKEKTKSNAVRH